MSKNLVWVSCQNNIYKSQLEKSNGRFYGFLIVFTESAEEIEPGKGSFDLPTACLGINPCLLSGFWLMSTFHLYSSAHSKKYPR